MQPSTFVPPRRLTEEAREAAWRRVWDRLLTSPMQKDELTRLHPTELKENHSIETPDRAHQVSGDSVPQRRQTVRKRRTAA